jgi:predicted metal-dependent HD superfamily phosphohydrolase
LDLERWTAVWQRLGARSNGLAVFERLAAAYAEPTRAYHNAKHIADCLTLLDTIRRLARHPDQVEAAIWFHDAVYVPGRTDNEEQSAELARTSLLEAQVALAATERIASLVLATRHATTPHQPDESLLCDIDLSILGAPPESFDLFERQIRQEYAHVAEQIYRTGRSEILRGFLNRPSIFQTAWFRELYEARARENLKRVLRTLSD